MYCQIKAEQILLQHKTLSQMGNSHFRIFKTSSRIRTTFACPSRSEGCPVSTIQITGVPIAVLLNVLSWTMTEYKFVLEKQSIADRQLTILQDQDQFCLP